VEKVPTYLSRREGVSDRITICTISFFVRYLEGGGYPNHIMASNDI